MKTFQLFWIAMLASCFSISIIGHVACNHHQDILISGTQEEGVYYAICALEQDLDSGVSGIVKFKQVDDQTIISAEVKGLQKGYHGIHIHEFGNCNGGCMTSGSHWNPLNKNHGGPSDEERHIGDLGNIYSDGINDAKLELTDKLITLSGPYSIIGRACVVHADQDDLGKGGQTDSLTTGHAGKRYACGTVGWSKPF